MSRVTLEITPLLNGDRRIAVACRHGAAVGGDLRTGPLSQPAVIAYLVQRHGWAWGCRCASKLEREFPATLIPAELMVAEVLL